MSPVPFLQRVARLLVQHHGHALDKVSVVLPSQRAGIYLRKYLAEESGTTIWSPRTYDMGGFLQELAGMRQGSSMEMLFLLYDTHRALAGSKAEPLEDLLRWAPATLRDMSEVDAHMLDLDTVYRDLKSYHEIEEWSFRLGHESPGQQRLEQHWRHTGLLHRSFMERMRERRTGTSGAVARMAAEKVLAGGFPIQWDAVWFAGSNALEPAATSVIKALKDQGKGYVAWDADRHYLDAPDQAAGRYLRRSIAEIGAGEVPPTDGIRTRTRTVVHVTVPNNIAQATHAGTLLAGLEPEDRARTAVVLADENLLMPLLGALPPDIGPFNITMGMPLQALPIHGCVEAFIRMHAGQKHRGGYRLADVERLLSHPFLHRTGHTARAIARLRETRLTHPDAEEIAKHMNAAGMEASSHVMAALSPVDHAQRDMPARMTALLAWARDRCAGDAYRMEQVFQMAKLQHHLDQGLARSGMDIADPGTYATVRQLLLREERIAFLGEPLQGMQVMGFLETRAIDHERVILLGASEGTLPPGTDRQSWIPHEIRRTYGLPLRSDADAISAYHFARMLQWTEHLTLVHGAEEGSEPSRFIRQWAHDLREGSLTEFRNTTYASPFPVRHSPRIRVSKDPFMIGRLRDICAKGLSPSALATWLRCPLDFHFTRIMGLKEPEEADGRLGSDVLGDAVHGVLEDIMRPMVGARMDPATLAEAATTVRDRLVQRLSTGFPPEVLTKGHFRLRIDMAGKALERYLHAEAKRCTSSESIPLAIEMDLLADLRPGVRIRGRSDRIEMREGIHHVLDLKTGTVDPKDLRLPGLEREHFTADRSYALQLLVYAWAYLVLSPDVAMVRSGIVPLRRSSGAQGVMLEVDGSPDLQRSMMPAIEQLLNTLVDEMHDPATPLEHAPESLYCTACITP